jgi:hypothetical protein
MDTTTRSYVARRLWAAAASVIAVLSTAVVLAQTPAAGGHEQRMAEQKAMMAKMTAADQKLADLAARMNAAKGEDKVAAMAAVLNELVAQRKQMHQSCGMMNTAPTPATGSTEPDHGAHHPGK